MELELFLLTRGSYDAYDIDGVYEVPMNSEFLELRNAWSELVIAHKTMSEVLYDKRDPSWAASYNELWYQRRRAEDRLHEFVRAHGRKLLLDTLWTESYP